ncbi:hypothetical protein L596_029625 [Steinernema carpocapsae]|uniref:Uncharacterized protein n=1 Tax=Steinernema carpocapsae TaxID=34508 RepID=A0A4V5ZXR8_STECR|nr:hypothetical protein L596_029625 [Steinernema carpocapsae]
MHRGGDRQSRGGGVLVSGRSRINSLSYCVSRVPHNKRSPVTVCLGYNVNRSPRETKTAHSDWKACDLRRIRVNLRAPRGRSTVTRRIRSHVGEPT